MKEQIKGLEAQVSTLCTIREYKDFLDTSPEKLALKRPKGKKEKWQHMTNRRRVPRIQEEQIEVGNCF